MYRYEVTRYCVGVAIDAGNLKPVGEALRDKYPAEKLVFCADNDQYGEINTGLTKATEAARAVKGYVASPVFRDITTKPTDFNDLHNLEGIQSLGGSCGMNQIKTVIDNAGPPEPLHESDEQVVEKLARLSPLEYDKQRKEIAKKLNARIRTLDDEVKKLRSDTSNTQGKIVEFEDPAAWHETVDGSDLFNSLTERIARHMAIPKNMANVVALWIVHSHCFEEFTHSARLIITAPEKECGKTVLLSHLVGNLVSKPQHADNVTPAVFFRLAQSHKPTFLIDEVDSWLREDSQLPSALNGGFESHGRVLRCEGDNNEVREFSTFAPTAMAGINLLDKLPPPIISRSIVIELQRSLPGEVVENYDQRQT